MGQTVRRQPGEVDIPSKDYIYHKNLIGFKGLDTRENPLVTDPLSCSDAENVWVDSNGNLTTRPRLQYVRQNLKHANAEVVNVIYTDNAYWTLYIKDGVYYLTRTDLATDTETDFAIPTIASPKIAITEYKNVYYLGCSAGYYSCNVGNTTFQQVSGYIPVGHLGETGYIYDESRNILNSQMRIPTVMPDSYSAPVLYPNDNTKSPQYVGPYVLYWRQTSPAVLEQFVIYDIRRSTIVVVPHVMYRAFSAFLDGELLVIITASAGGGGGNYQPHVGIDVHAYNTSTYAVTHIVTRTINLQPLLAPGMKISDPDVYSSYGTTAGTVVISANSDYIYVSCVYLQWDAANGSKRGPSLRPEDPTAETGQYVQQAIAITYSDLVGAESTDTLIAENRIVQLGVSILPEHRVTWQDNPPDIPIFQKEQYGRLKIAAVISVAGSLKVYSVTDVPLSDITNGVASVSSADTVTAASYAITPVYKNLYIDNIVYCGMATERITIYGYGRDSDGHKLQRLDLNFELTQLTTETIYATVCDDVFSSFGQISFGQYGAKTRITNNGCILFQQNNSDAEQLILDYHGNTVYAGQLPIQLKDDFGVFQGVIALHNKTDSQYVISYKWLDIYFRYYPSPGNISENPSLRGVLFLDNVYWWFGKTNIYGTANEDLTYMPESRKLDAPSEIRNWVRLTDTSFLVFCESDTCLYYKDTSSGLWLRTVLNLPFEILYPDETSESCYAALNTGPTYVTRNGIYEIALSENLFTNERQAQNISDPLTTLQGGLLRKLIPSIAHLQTVRYKDWQLYIFTRANATKTEIIAQEIATYNFFYWTLPIVFQAVYLAHSQVYLVTKKATTYTFSEAELLREYKNGSTVLAAIKCYGDEVYDTVKKTTSLNQIDWHWHSAIINLDTVQYYKTLLALIFGMNDYDDESRIMFEYRTDIYYKSHTEQPTQVYDDYVYKIRATQKPMAIPRFMYIRVRISSVKVPENEDCLPEEFMCKANLSQLTFKYKVLRGPLL